MCSVRKQLCDTRKKNRFTSFLFVFFTPGGGIGEQNSNVFARSFLTRRQSCYEFSCETVETRSNSRVRYLEIPAIRQIRFPNFLPFTPEMPCRVVLPTGSGDRTESDRQDHTDILTGCRGAQAGSANSASVQTSIFRLYIPGPRVCS